MGDTVQIDIQTAKTGSHPIEEAVSAIRSTINNITSDSEAVAGAQWQGPAANKFRLALNDWRDEGTALNRRLDDIVQTLHDGFSKYSQMEAANETSFKPH